MNRATKRVLQKNVAKRAIIAALTHLYQYWDWSQGVAVPRPGKSKAMMSLYGTIPGLVDWPIWAKEVYIRHVCRLNFPKTPLPAPSVNMPEATIIAESDLSHPPEITWTYHVTTHEIGWFTLKENGTYIIEAKFSATPEKIVEELFSHE